VTVVLLYHRPTEYWHKDASTVDEHIAAFGRHSQFPVVPVNTHLGLPHRLPRAPVDALILHYSLFGSGVYMLDEPMRDYVRASSAYKVAFFQDEYRYCRKRFAFLDEYGVDCIFTCLEPSEFDKVYRRYSDVECLYSNFPGYVSQEILNAAERFALPDERREIDVGYRGRPLPAYMGEGAREKTEIGGRFRELARGTELSVDIGLEEEDRLYGDDWHRFMARCRCVLGVESGVSCFDLEDEVLTEYERVAATGREPTFEDLRDVLARWDHNVYYRTISPRHFEAAALRVCQVLFEGHYSGVLEPAVHYIALKKDFSNFDEVVRLVKDGTVRRELTENAYRDLIASGEYSYGRMIKDLDDALTSAGFDPAKSRAHAQTTRRAVSRGRVFRRVRAEWRWTSLAAKIRIRRLLKGRDAVAAGPNPAHARWMH
jgi:hypothetical protein